MPDEHPHSPETPHARPSEVVRHGNQVEKQQADAQASSRITTFTKNSDEDAEKLQERFINEILFPVIEWVILPDARDLVADITASLEQGMPDAARARGWGERAFVIVGRMSHLLKEIQQAASRNLGPVGAFAMSEIAHHCPKFLHMFIAPTCRSLADALKRGDTDGAQNARTIILKELGGADVLPAQARFQFLLEKYFITKLAFTNRFEDAKQGINAPGNFTRIVARLERRTGELLRDVLQLEQHSYDVEFITNIPEQQQEHDLIPRAGLTEEVLAELMLNAFKVMEQTHKGSKLLVSVILRKDGSMLLKVRDDGPGIGDRNPEELFKAGETTTQRFGGTGMGLTFLRENIQDHFGGFLDAQKNEEIDESPGMTFSCILPPEGGWQQKNKQ
ncbi:hypothetical protein AUJ46_04795 [Candidatus Peregrinibacteria bacterium CG1_02_54_53]|nr:MAG: hypothetical protein AUJ46_04795 [Candidatus Peregrinibacteria bacterium CG1_02_54_53]